MENMYIDELIDMREQLRNNKNWKAADEIRDYLDTKDVYIFDTVHGQVTLHLNNNFFKEKDRKEETKSMTRRKYIEYLEKQSINAEKRLAHWMYVNTPKERRGELGSADTYIKGWVKDMFVPFDFFKKNA
jgi:hypothetical protein